MNGADVNVGVGEPVFVGQFDVPISPSGTFVIPEEWRFITEKGSSVFLMPDKIAGCVNLMSAGEMEKLLTSVRERALTDPECYQALQVIGKHSSQVKVDATGAVALPDFIRNEAGLKGRAILKGVLRQIKIWNPEKIAGGEC
jgi:DNA-binding transcriptional regulator/RsmH inhibitor MraZ